MRRVLLTVVLAAMLPGLVSAGAAGPVNVQITRPRWVAPIDSRTTDQWLSESAGVVYGARNGQLVAIDLRSGGTRWIAPVAVAGRSASGGGFVAAPSASAISFIDARNGRTVATRRIGANPGVSSYSRGFVAVVAARSGATVARAFSFDGTPRWTKTFPFCANPERIVSLGGDAIGLRGRDAILVIDGRDGRVVAQTDGIEDLIGADGRYLWFNVVNGGIKGLDLDRNRSRALHGSIVQGAARVEHGVAVTVIDGRLKKIDLARDVRDGAGVDALRVDGRWVGGPAAGRIFLERGDGMYVRALDDRAKPRRVAWYTGEARIVAADGRRALIGMENGTIYVVDVSTGTQLAHIETTCHDYEGFAASGSTTIVHCDDGTHAAELVAFDRFPQAAR
jgi:outer membrane protein assembly factor BamB